MDISGMKTRIRYGQKDVLLSTIGIIITILFFAFERLFAAKIDFLNNMDELFCIIVVIELILQMRLHNCFSKKELQALIFLCSIVVIGCLGNILSGILINKFAILIDIISTFKVVIAYYWIRMKKISSNEWDKIIKIIAKIMRFVLIIMAICYLGAILFQLPFFEKMRYGIPSYRFLFNAAGNYSKLFYLIIPILSADLYYGVTKKKIFSIVCALILWASTMRTRAIAYAVCYIIFAVWFFIFRNKKAKTKINIHNLVPLAAIGLIIGWEQIIFYFTNETQARANLLKYAFVTLKRYFPIGAGFGTYGSDIATKYYSKLYEIYGFRNIYGMGYVHTNFLNDNNWPTIMGQFGVLGVICMVLLLYKLYTYMVNAVRTNKYFYFSTICMIAFLLTSSIASKSYFEFTSISIFLFHGVLVQREKVFAKYKSDIEIAKLD